jgi:hypothetical protein
MVPVNLLYHGETVIYFFDTCNRRQLWTALLTELK